MKLQIDMLEKLEHADDDMAHVVTVLESTKYLDVICTLDIICISLIFNFLGLLYL